MRRVTLLHSGILATLLANVILAVLNSKFNAFDGSVSLLFNSANIIVPMVAAALVGTIYVRRTWPNQPKLVAAWSLLAAGFFFVAVGEGLRGFHIGQTGQDPSGPIPSDACYGIAYFCQFLGILSLIRNQSRMQWSRLALDNFLVCVCGFFFVWKLFVGNLFANSYGTAIEGLVSCGYPVLVFAIGWCATFLISSSIAAAHLRFPQILLGIGLLVASCGDLALRYQHTLENQTASTSLDLAWVVGYSIVALGALFGLRTSSSEEASPEFVNGRPVHSHSLRQRIGLSLPYSVAFVSLSAIFTEEVKSTGTVSATTLIVALLCGFVGFGRHLFALLEQHQAISNFADTLEQRVNDRTRQLEARFSIAKAVSSARNIVDFAESAAEQVANILPIDGVIISIRHGILENHQRGLVVHSGIGHSISELLGDQVYDNSPFISCDPLTMVIAEDWHMVSLMRVPLRAMNVIYGNVFVARIDESFSQEERTAVESLGLELASAFGHNILYSQAIEISEKDYLTNLLNHRAISKRLQELVLSNNEEHLAVGVMMVDVNGFKLFNDTYGHAAGDDVLRCIAGRLKEFIAEHGGFVGRTGGDEFLMVLPDFSLNDTYRIASQVQTVIKKIEFKIDGYMERLPLEVNIGIAAYPESGQNPYTIMAAADNNLAEAKRDRVTFVSAESDAGNRVDVRRNSSMEAVDMMLTAIDNVDAYTRKHSLDVMRYSVWLAEELGYSHSTIEQISTAAMLHDVGKIAVPTSILRKPGALTEEEFDLMKRHTTIGAMIVQAMPNMHDIVDGVRSHHERWDGKGYPDGLAEENIPFLGRLLAVADAFSAMTTDRPYRKGMSWPVAAHRIRQGIGSQFDPRLAEAFLRVLAHRGIPVDAITGLDDSLSAPNSVRDTDRKKAA